MWRLPAGAAGSSLSFHGTSICISADGGYFVEGAPEYGQTLPDGSGQTNARVGVVFVFARAGDRWIIKGTMLVSPLAATATGSDDLFGNSVSVSCYGEYVAVGAPGEEDGGSNRGAVYVYLNIQDDGTWEDRTRVIPNSRADGWIELWPEGST